MAKSHHHPLASKIDAALALAIVSALLLLPTLHTPHSAPQATAVVGSDGAGVDCAACKWIASAAALVPPAPERAALPREIERTAAPRAVAIASALASGDHLARGPPAPLV